MDEDEVLLPSASSAAPMEDSTARELLSPIISPSPYPQHNSGPTSTRYKTALARVTQQPTSDVEAWQALITEVNACYKSIPNIHAVDAETEKQLDWVESCYGYLLQHFPYATTQIVFILECLLAQSARFGEEHGPTMDLGREPSRRAMRCEQKVEHLLKKTLGFDSVDGTAASSEEFPGMNGWCVELWLLYVKKVARNARRQASSLPVDEREAVIRNATKEAYELAVQHAGFGHNNHVLWKQYLAFVRSWTVQDHVSTQQQMVQLRSIYQRLVCLPMTGLDQLWNEYEAFERTQSEALAQALIQEFTPKYQHARTVYLERNRVYDAAELQLDRLAVDPVAEGEEDYALKMEEEYKLLKVWKVRLSYQRTNPERLSPPELAIRIRCGYQEMLSVLTRHPECWHQWSMWELHGLESKSQARASAVLRLGQSQIPDSTLLAFAEAQIVELFGSESSGCIQVMERFLARSPNTLGFVLCQQMVRRYKGAEEARAVFAKARRVLVSETADSRKKVNEKKTGAEPESTETEGEAADGIKLSEQELVKRNWMVTNRLDPSVGKETNGNAQPELVDEAKSNENQGATVVVSRGVITWHLFAAHAAMEHRLNRLPDVAARIYELGLRKHRSFLTRPAYVMRYAQLLLELGDTINIRALLTRAVAACEEQGKEGALAALWDITLHFESLLNADGSSASHLDDIERKRRAAVLGPDVEDVATGGLMSTSDVSLIGAQKISVSEQLIRTEGYDISSKIVNGMSRTLDLLDVTGCWGDGSTFSLSRKKVKQDQDNEISAGMSDAVYQKRAQYQALAAAGRGFDAQIGESVSGGARLLSARERLQQGAGAGPGQSTAMMLVIQQSPEWIRSLLLILPASKLRLPIVPKPPPHLTEMALTALRQSDLPAERPVETSSRKRKADDTGGDSSDDENGNRKGGGYGTAFRSRQRSRMTQDNGTD
jgi:hypothetical protein